MNTIVVYEDDINGKLTNDLCDMFIFESFTIVITKNKDDDFANIFDIATNNGDIRDCSCRVVLPDVNGIFDIATEFNWVVTENETTVKFRTKEEFEQYKEIASLWADYLVSVMTYIMTTKRERTRRIKTTKNGKEETRKRKDKQKTIYLFEDIIDYVNERGMTTDKISTRKINCPCWSVRGHYRHYKSGKVIFVKEHRKGKERNKTKPKDKIYTA